MESLGYISREKEDNSSNCICYLDISKLSEFDGGSVIASRSWRNNVKESTKSTKMLSIFLIQKRIVVNNVKLKKNVKTFAPVRVLNQIQRKHAPF